MKKKKLVRQALEKPEMYSQDEVLYFQMWLKAKECRKERKRNLAILKLERDLLA